MHCARTVRRPFSGDCPSLPPIAIDVRSTDSVRSDVACTCCSCHNPAISLRTPQGSTIGCRYSTGRKSQHCCTIHSLHSCSGSRHEFAQKLHAVGFLEVLCIYIRVELEDMDDNTPRCFVCYRGAQLSLWLNPVVYSVMMTDQTTKFERNGAGRGGMPCMGRAERSGISQKAGNISGDHVFKLLFFYVPVNLRPYGHRR